MKTIKLLSLIPLFASMFFISCEEGINADVNTTFNKNITADILDSKKSSDTTNTFPFFASDTLDITEDSKVQENLDKFKDLEISKITCELTGIPENQSITELNVIIPEAQLHVTLENINENNNSISLNITPELLNALGEFLHTNHQVSIQVSGFSSYAPMQLGVLLSFESTIITNL